jgi:hypothetical protein
MSAKILAYVPCPQMAAALQLLSSFFVFVAELCTVQNPLCKSKAYTPCIGPVAAQTYAADLPLSYRVSVRQVAWSLSLPGIAVVPSDRRGIVAIMRQRGFYWLYSLGPASLALRVSASG